MLKECISALQKQTVLINEIIVVNNSCTDGTLEWLQQQTGIRTITQENVGGSGGFHTGFKESTLSNYDWIWGMDDDTIPMPDALEKMLDKLYLFEKNKVGFLCSKVVWTDGTPHLMNLPDIKVFAGSKYPFTTFDSHNIFLVDGCSFVSILLNVQMIKQLGLPYKQFYIWYDDKEYTNRITKQGFYGAYCPESLTLHKTPSNYRVDIYADSSNNLWKHAYGIRNELFITKRDKGFLYFLFFAPAKLFYGVFQILKSRKTDRLKFIKTLMISTAQAFTFNPAIDRI